MTIASRIGVFIIFLILTLITLGFYPLYFVITRMEEQTMHLREIAANTRNR